MNGFANFCIGSIGRINSGSWAGNICTIYFYNQCRTKSCCKCSVDGCCRACCWVGCEIEFYFPIGSGCLNSIIVRLHKIPIGGPVALPNSIGYIVGKICSIIHELSPIGIGIGIAGPVVAAMFKFCSIPVWNPNFPNGWCSTSWYPHYISQSSSGACSNCCKRCFCKLPCSPWTKSK